MNGLTLFNNPMRELSLLRREMDRLSNELFPSRQSDDGSAVWMPRADLAETDEAWILSLDLPGLSADDVEVTLEDDTLTISGEREVSQEQKEGRFHRIERSYGRFFRTIQFGSPVDPDNIEASFEDGVLTVRVAKAEASRPRRIEVQGRRRNAGTQNEGDGSSTESRRVEVNEAKPTA